MIAVKNVQKVISSLSRVLKPDQLSVAEAVRSHHSHDESHFRAVLPEAVVFPSCVEESSAIMRLCNECRVPVIPFGTGTGLIGGVIAEQGCIAVDLSQMNQIKAVNEDDMDCVVEAGVTRLQLNNYLRDGGLWFPVDPGADASLGGMCSTGASGTNAVRYGTMKENVKNLEVVLSSGNVIHTAGEGRRARKSSAGYNLTNLFVGSEGTLGIITKATLRLFGLPSKIAAAVCSFPSIVNAISAVVDVIHYCVPVARIEFMDELGIHAVNKYSKMTLPEKSTLCLEFHGSEAEVNSQVTTVEEVCHSYGGSEFAWSLKPEERAKLWKARHSIFYAVLALKPNNQVWITDVCVPISKLADAIAAAKKDILESGLTGRSNFYEPRCRRSSATDNAAFSDVEFAWRTSGGRKVSDPHF